MVRIRGLGFAVVALAAASCQLLAGGIGPRTFDGPTDDANAPTDSNSGPADGSVVIEASAHDSTFPETKDSGIGATDSATRPDSSGVTDSAMPPDSSGVDAAPFCASLSPQPTFCDDFDTLEAGSFLSQWSSAPVAASVDTMFYKSSPNACLFSLAPVAGGGQVSSYISTFFPQYFSTATLSFEVRPRTYLFQNAVANIELSGGGAGSYGLALAIGESGGMTSLVSESNVVTGDSGVATVPHSFSGAPPLSVWTLVVLTVTIPSGSTPGMVTLSFDGTNKETFDIMAVNAAGYPTILLGAVAVGMSSGATWAMDFDNVVFDLQP